MVTVHSITQDIREKHNREDFFLCHRDNEDFNMFESAVCYRDVNMLVSEIELKN